MQVDGDRLVLAAEKNFKADLTGIDVFDVDFSAKKVTVSQSIEFNSENVAKLYSQVKEEHILSRSNKLIGNKFVKPEHLPSTSMQHLVLDKGNIYIVSEVLTSATNSKGNLVGYFTDDILVTAFHSNKNAWNSIIGRRMFCGDIVIGSGWVSLRTLLNQQGDLLQLLTSEYQKESKYDVSSYVRSIDMQTGAVSPPQRLLSASFWITSALTSWLSADQLILFRSSKVMGSKGNMVLNLVPVGGQGKQ
jgi:hypothetical protein